MSREFPCFIVEDAGRQRAWLRCYIGDKSCPREEQGYHDARVPIGELTAIRNERGYTMEPNVELWIADPRWPATCACGWPLGPPPPGYRWGSTDEVTGAHWQVFTKTIYRRVDDEREGTLEDHGVGAMFDAFWLTEHYRAPDGKAWSVILPPGNETDMWHIFGPSTGPDHAHWSVSGEAPLFTATPSIQTHRYHGHLTNGVLVD